MRSARMDDATARSRIRDVAIAQFGASGFTATSVRSIATAAGVSPALILHHFTSKQGLRESCDRHVLEIIHNAKTDTFGDRSALDAIAELASIDDYGPAIAYIGRSINDGTELGQRLFESMVDEVEEYMATGVEHGRVVPSADPRGRAVMLTLTSLGFFTHGVQALAAAGRNPVPWPGNVPAGASSPASATSEPDSSAQDSSAQDARSAVIRVSERLMFPLLELYTNGLLVDREFLDAYSVAPDSSRQTPHTRPPPGDTP